MSNSQAPNIPTTTAQRLISVARPEWKALSWGLLFLVLSSVAGLSFPQIIRWILDNVLATQRGDLLLPAVGGLLAVFWVQAIFGSLRYYFFTLSGERMVLQLRKNLFRHLIDQEVAFFDFHRTGDLMSRLSSDCTTLQNTVSVNISQGLRNVGQVVGGLGFMLYTSWQLSLMMLVLVPPIALAASYFGKKIRAASKTFQSSLARASEVAEESLSGVRTVKAFVQEETETLRYKRALDESYVSAILRTRSIADFLTLAMVAGFTAVCFVLWMGGRSVVSGELSLGDLTQFLLYLMLVAIGVGSLGSLWGDLMAGVGASQRVFELLGRASQETRQGLRPNLCEGRIEFRDVHFHYPTRTDIEVLKGINLKLDHGNSVALVGPSGSGKTTIASLLLKLYEASSGEIFLDDKPLKEISPTWLRSQIGIVSQEPLLISASIADNIRYGKPDATEAEIQQAAAAANALEFIQSFPDGFATQVGERGIQLSGGQKQRVAIARALLKNPKILILDEATSNLDAASEHLVQEALQRLLVGRTTLMIAHRLSTIRNADEILVLQNGVVVQKGKHHELVSHTEGLYFQLLQRQIEGSSH